MEGVVSDSTGRSAVVQGVWRDRHLSVLTGGSAVTMQGVWRRSIFTMGGSTISAE